MNVRYDSDFSVRTQFYDLDAITGGLHRSNLIIIASRPGMGKTSFALNIACNVAKYHNLPVAIFTLKMSQEHCIMQLLSAEAQLEISRLKSGRITEEEMEPLMAAMTVLSELPIDIDDTGNLTLMQMRSKVRRLQAKHNGQLGLILLDYLQLIEDSSSKNRVQELSAITRSLKRLAKEFNVPIIALSQVNHTVEQRSNKRPILLDLEGSGSLENDADLVMMLYRDEYYYPDTLDRGIVDVFIAKHRNGPTASLKLLFQPEFNRFQNLGNY
ncbi:DnaB-like helicase C-terminal domain-containing protein [Cyanobacterium aponinum FACHB-4101]|uniref:replicative DNA helicase n=1 Tax=Cyanobacterium aponinum TaxID=379064 RepID=UPI00168045C1|nr:DnaB-like helicase C-terminal domain-containing protein [Cyanobacterium aponinum]MBD2394530.1 DnaB-like helicase C-terminal domain-containing protein [Cyanobacterium aponinum FACHB-4101]